MRTAATSQDVRVIAYAAARLVGWAGVAMLPAAAVGLLAGELTDATAMLVGAGLAVSLGALGKIRWHTRRPLMWGHGFALVGAGWILVAVVAAVPLFLSGQYGGFLDAVFDAMAGATTTGMSLLQDQDHTGLALHTWRLTLHLIGGLATIVIALALLSSGDTQVATVNTPEGRDDRIAANLLRVGRMTGRLCAGWAVAGIVVLWIFGVLAGLTPARALLHGVALFVTAFTTGGFTLQSTSVGYYHAPGIEVTLLVLMVAGALAVTIHQQLWQQNPSELLRATQARAAAISLAIITTIVMLGLGRAGAFTDAEPLFRQGVFAAVAAHTTTGVTLGHPRLLATDWGLIAPAALVAAMTIGGMAGSTAGGVKLLRVALIAKGVVKEIRRVLLPESALVVASFHQRRRRTLTDDHVSASATVLLLFVVLALGGALASLYFISDISLDQALFDSTSALANAGPSLGVVRPDAAASVKLVLLGQMWLGRIEFLAAFALLGALLTSTRRSP